MLNKFSSLTNNIIALAQQECTQLNCSKISLEHLLLALTHNGENIAARALASMNVRYENLEPEVRRSLLAAKEVENDFIFVSKTRSKPECLAFTKTVRQVFEHAEEFRQCYGQHQIEPEHLLLAIIREKDSSTIKILEELGSNLQFLTRQVIKLMAKHNCLNEDAPTLKTAIINGITEMVAAKEEAVANLQRLSELAGKTTLNLPEVAEVAPMTFVSCISNFLSIQVGFQRYLLEENIKLLKLRTGPLDKELLASIVSSSAQNLRSEVRATIEQLWGHEFKLFRQMPSEAEHDLIGSIIEDLWWTHSEEIALLEVFDEALEDYRKKQVLSLQKRRLEISQRLTKLRARLHDTFKQCFLKKPCFNHKRTRQEQL